MTATGITRIRVRQTVDGMWDWKVEEFTEDTVVTELPGWQQTECGYDETSRDAAIAAARWHAGPPPWETAE